MQFPRLLVVLGLIALPIRAQTTATPLLTYVPGSSVKLYQVNGDCDWVAWDASLNNKPPTCKATTSRTETNADVLGDDAPVVFEHSGELITFGDTPVVSGSTSQSGGLTPLPVFRIGGIVAKVLYAALAAPGEYQFNVIVPSTLADGDQPVIATYAGQTTQAGALLAVAR